MLVISVFSWGFSHGQFEFSSKETLRTPFPLAFAVFGAHIPAHISCADSCIAYDSVSKKILVWGTNLYGQVSLVFFNFTVSLALVNQT